MTSPYALPETIPDMTPEDRAAYGFGRVRNAAYEAVQNLWRRRKSEGLTQQSLGERIGMDPARVCKYLQGPGNWTLQTFGALVEALDGEAEIIVRGLDEAPAIRTNYHAYCGYELPATSECVRPLSIGAGVASSALTDLLKIQTNPNPHFPEQVSATNEKVGKLTLLAS